MIGRPIDDQAEYFLVREEFKIKAKDFFAEADMAMLREGINGLQAVLDNGLRRAVENGEV